MRRCMPCAFGIRRRQMEAPFFVGERALKQIQPDMPSDEAGLLNAFDRNRERI